MDCRIKATLACILPGSYLDEPVAATAMTFVIVRGRVMEVELLRNVLVQELDILTVHTRWKIKNSMENRSEESMLR